MQRIEGALLAFGGVGFFVAGVLHPTGQRGQNFDAAIVSMLRNPLWSVTHWCALVSALVVAVALFLLLERRESVATLVGIRLGIVSTIFMAVEFAVELAAKADVTRFASGESPSMVSLIDAMQAAGFPGLGLAFILIATGTRWTPKWVVALAVVGSAALAIGGLVVQGMHVVALGPVFLIGNLLPVWMVWAGVHLARHADSVMLR